MTTIIAINLTAFPISLPVLGLTIPASGNLTLTDFSPVFEIQTEDVLFSELAAGNVRLNVDGVLLTATQSIEAITPLTLTSQTKANFTATTDPTISSDASLGYRNGSVWLNTSTGVLWVCYNPAVGAAVWGKISITNIDVGAHASRHLPSGSDPLTTATPVTIDDSTNSVGTANSFSRSDHVHAHGVRGGGTLHAVATPSLAGFMSAVDKTKLDGLGASVTSSVITAATISTTSSTFQDAFPSSNITIPNNGDYLVLFDTNVSSTNAFGRPEIGVRLNGTVLPDSQRFAQGNGGARISGITHTILLNLVVGDVITGVFRRASGSGITSLLNRRLTAIRVNQ